MQVINHNSNRITTNIGKPTKPTKQSPNYYKKAYIDAECFKMAVANYRKKRNEYNDFVNAQNETSRGYNEELYANQHQNPTTPQQQLLINSFNQDHKKLTPLQYNTKAREFNLTNAAPLITLKKIQTIKYQSEAIFTTLLGFYASQLRQHYQTRKKLNLPTGSIPHVKIHSLDIAEHKINGERVLNVSPKTVRLTVARFFEAGILLGRVYRGTQQPIRGYFNAEILLIKDGNNALQKSLTLIDNQRFTSFKKTNQPELINYTRTLKRNSEKKVVNNNHAENNNYENTKITGTPEESKVKKLAANPFPVSQRLANQIQEQGELAGEIATGTHDNFVKTELHHFQNEAYNGTLTQREYKTLVIQYFMKCCAQLWADKNLKIGSVIIGFQHLNDSKLETFTGKLFTKQTMFLELQKWLWMLDREVTRRKKPNTYTLFPNHYFDVFKTTGGFWHWEGKYNSQQRRKAKRKQQAVQRAAVAKQEAKNNKKYKQKINNYLNNKMSLTDLQEFVERNLPPEYLKNLAKSIEKQNLYNLKIK